MRDIWYADKRDVVKWATLLHLADTNKASDIIQVAYYRPDSWPSLDVDGRAVPLSSDVLNHFRSVRNGLGTQTRFNIHVWNDEFSDRDSYTRTVASRIAEHGDRPLVVLLDPDTGLEPARPALEHVREAEVALVWNTLQPGDVLVLYQHQTNRNGTPWVEPKRMQLARALGVLAPTVGVAQAPKLATDVVLFFAIRGRA